MLRKLGSGCCAFLAAFACLISGQSADLEAEKARALKLLNDTKPLVTGNAAPAKSATAAVVPPPPPAVVPPPAAVTPATVTPEVLLADNVERFAVIIGIDRYGDAAPPLQGCVNDARQMEQLLTTKFDFKADKEHRRLLLNGDATHAAIKAALAELAMRADDSPNCVCVVYFSGYGSVVDAANPNADRTLVAVDSRSATPAKDITERELTEWLAPIKNLTVILDCSFKEAASKGVRIRALKPANPAMQVPAVMAGDIRLENAPFTILAAADREQNAFEIYAPETGEFHGALTRQFVKEARRLPPGGSTTLQNVFQTVNAEVRASCPSQQVKLKGKTSPDQLLFDLRVLVSEPFADAYWQPSGLEIEVGAVHGAAIGSQYEVYKPDERNLEPGKGLVTATIAEVDSLLSLATVSNAGNVPTLKSRAVLRKEKFGSQRTGVYLNSPLAGATLHDRLHAGGGYLLAGKNFTPRYRDLFEVVDDPAEASFIVQEVSGADFKASYQPKYPWAKLEPALDAGKNLVLLSADGSLLADPIAIQRGSASVDSLLGQLTTWEKWRRLMELTSVSTPEQLGVKCVWQRTTGAAASSVEIVNSGAADISYEVKNDSGSPLNFALLDLRSDGATEVLYPNQPVAALGPGTAVRFNLHVPVPAGRSELTHHLKMIYTTRTVDFHSLKNLECLPANADPFAKLLIQRSLAGRYADVEAIDVRDWATDLHVLKIQK